ncbi:MAG: aminopeptidase P family protein [Blautia sp.]|nr:aminopeptidase P family protein [Blautia sp.]MDY5030330.1 aminopeptidase P family protein [Blautia sp.]
MTAERIARLRALMKERKIDAYLVPTDDFHGSEYVGEYFKARKFITGFTGSAGTALIMEDMAGLWTDGRYFIQAERQIQGSGVTLFKMGEPGVPTIHEFLEQNLKKGQCLGFDGRTVMACETEELQEKMNRIGASIHSDEDLIGEIWEERPQLSCEPVWELEERWSGKSRTDKIKEIRAQMEKEGADVYLLSSLEGIAWLLNIRGNDIHTCPVVLSFLMMTKEKILLFANEKAFSVQIQENLAKDGVELRPYGEIYEAAASIEKDQTVILDKKCVNGHLVSCIPEDVRILDRENLTELPKSIKNPVEVENMKAAHIRDGVAVTKFICWLKKHVGKETITEISAAEKLYEFRSQQEHFLGNSFDPIISYGEHAAMNHYSATPETDAAIEAEGFLLADTGGHYLEGTTDITRTIAMGKTTEEQKQMFTAVLRGTLNLAAAKFLYGCTGWSLDYLARGPLWEMGKDFKHGTGHGVGYVLSVHEGPNGFHFRPARKCAIFEEGMITSDEPGYYVEGEYGIRHENLIVCKKAEKNSFGQFLCFEHLTMVPFDLDAVLPEQMSEREKALLNAYHGEVYRKISPYLDPEEKEWLKEATREI